MTGEQIGATTGLEIIRVLKFEFVNVAGPMNSLPCPKIVAELW